MEAFGLITTKLEGIESQLRHVVTVDQLKATESKIVLEFEKSIEKLQHQINAVDKTNKELQKRVSDLEVKLKTFTGQPEVAFRRISFIGLPMSDELGRIKFISEWMGTHFPAIACSVGNISKGPMRARTLTAIGYAEFADSDLRSLVLKTIRSKQPSCVYSGTPILVKPALSQMIRDRIWALNTAYDLVKKHASADGKTVDKRKDSNRAILVDGNIVFDQSSSVVGMGNFLGVFSDQDIFLRK